MDSLQEEPGSTEGNKFNSYRSKKTANKAQRSREHLIESNTFAKSKRKVGPFLESASTEGLDQDEMR